MFFGVEYKVPYPTQESTLVRSGSRLAFCFSRKPTTDQYKGGTYCLREEVEKHAHCHYHRFEELDRKHQQ